MTDQAILILISIVTLLIAVAVIWLYREQRKQQQEFQQLSQMLQRTNQDVAGLCSAAVIVDDQISVTSEQLKALLDKVSGADWPEDSEHCYQGVIQKVQSGADAEYLMQECGISRDEAQLLIRLHGNQPVNAG